MTLLTLGINHKTAPVAVREKVAFAPDHLPAQLREANASHGVQEIAILSTCNRTELYFTADHDNASLLLQWMNQVHGVALEELEACHYAHVGEDAVQHGESVHEGTRSVQGPQLQEEGDHSAQEPACCAVSRIRHHAKAEPRLRTMAEPEQCRCIGPERGRQ